MAEFEYLDPSVIYGEELESWEELWDEGDSLYGNVHNIITQSVVLPAQNILMPIATTYCLVPSKWAKILPILFSYGEKGTGKSTFAIIASKLHGQKQLFSAADTFASIRNSLDMMRWVDPSEKQFEKDGCILCWDNIHADTLTRDPKIYSMLLFGYNRNSERINIASVDGTNREFHVFSPKVMSSIDAIHLDGRFEELHRRLLVIPHKKFERLSDEDLKHLPSGFNISTDKLDLDSINWDGIEDKFFEFWENPDNCKMYARYRMQLTKRGKKPFTIPDSIHGENWTISVDLICTGLLVGTWQTTQEAIDCLGQYWEWYKENAQSNGSATMKILAELIDREVGHQLQMNELFIKAGQQPIELSIPAIKVKQCLDLAQQNGELDTPNRQDNVIRLMGQLGWRLDRSGWVQIR